MTSASAIRLSALVAVLTVLGWALARLADALDYSQ